MTWRYRYDDAHDMYDDDRGCDDECGHDVLERRREAERDRDAEDRKYIEEARRQAQVAAVEAWAAKAYHHGGTVDGTTVDILDGFIRNGQRMALVQYLDGTRATVPVADVEVNR